MAFGELYTALENKTVDGQENPYSVILSNKFYEVQKFVSATNHTFTQNIIIVSKKFWDRLSPEEQKMLRDTFAETREYQRDQTSSPPTRRWTSSRPRACSSTRSRRPSTPACRTRPSRSSKSSPPTTIRPRSSCSTSELARIRSGAK